MGIQENENNNNNNINKNFPGFSDRIGYEHISARPTLRKKPADVLRQKAMEQPEVLVWRVGTVSRSVVTISQRYSLPW